MTPCDSTTVAMETWDITHHRRLQDPGLNGRKHLVHIFQGIDMVVWWHLKIGRLGAPYFDLPLTSAYLVTQCVEELQFSLFMLIITITRPATNPAITTKMAGQASTYPLQSGAPGLAAGARLLRR